MVLLLSLIVSPAAWTHYYLLLLLPLGLYLGGRLPMPPDALTRWLFWLGYALTALPVVMPAMDPEFELPRSLAAEIAARTLVSAWLFGALPDAGLLRPGRMAGDAESRADRASLTAAIKSFIARADALGSAFPLRIRRPHFAFASHFWTKAATCPRKCSSSWPIRRCSARG